MDVLLVHAYPFDRRLWAEQVAAASPGLRVHAFDLPGFGTSTEESCDIDAYGEAIDHAAAGLGRFVLCGLSLGGYAAFAWLRRHPGDARLAGLVLADTRSEADSEVARVARDRTVSLIRGEGLGALADELLPRLLSPATGAAVRQRARAIIESQRASAVVAATIAMRDRPDSTDLLAGIEVPLLGLAGSEDTVTPPAGVERMARAAPRGRFEVLPGAAHLANLDAPAAFFDALLRFCGGLT